MSAYDAREACVYSNYNWTQWLELRSDERAMCVAHYRLHNLIEAHVNEAAMAKSTAGSGAGSRTGEYD